LKINAPGAVMFTTADDIYFVSKVIMDKIRDSLNKDKQKGIPFDNSRMMDELLQFHIITPNQKGKANAGYRVACLLVILAVVVVVSVSVAVVDLVLATFAIFVAALLHDIGKTISDVDIMLYDAKHKALGKEIDDKCYQLVFYACLITH
jgi:hypothetical protein